MHNSQYSRRHSAQEAWEKYAEAYSTRCLLVVLAMLLVLGLMTVVVITDGHRLGLGLGLGFGLGFGLGLGMTMMVITGYVFPVFE